MSLTESFTNKVEFSYNCWLCLIYKMIMNISLFGLYWINIVLVLFLCIRTAEGTDQKPAFIHGLAQQYVNQYSSFTTWNWALEIVYCSWQDFYECSLSLVKFFRGTLKSEMMWCLWKIAHITVWKTRTHTILCHFLIPQKILQLTIPENRSRKLKNVRFSFLQDLFFSAVKVQFTRSKKITTWSILDLISIIFLFQLYEVSFLRVNNFFQ